MTLTEKAQALVFERWWRNEAQRQALLAWVGGHPSALARTAITHQCVHAASSAFHRMQQWQRLEERKRG